MSGDLLDDATLTPMPLEPDVYQAARAYLARRCPDPQDRELLADMLGLGEL